MIEKNVVLLSMIFQWVSAQERPVSVVFVCEHGSAKSVIAAEYLNRISTSQNMQWNVESRGIKPESFLQSSTKDGLERDGFKLDKFKIKGLTQKDLKAGNILVTIGCDLPDTLDTSGIQLIQWNDIPSVSKDYTVARDKILQRVDALLSILKR